ncbi:MAG: SLBB domain-containing protein [Desulfobacterales bacterium]|nr:SLBB domain-containing protein [Desulfobacterales bacterium]
MATAASAQSDAFYIGPRDVLNLTVHAGGELQSDVNLTVSATGIIKVPFCGPMQVEALTTSQLEEKIQTLLARDFFVDPEVHVYVKEYHSLRYHITGAVKSPGTFEMTARATLMELIAKAGGTLPDRGNQAYIQREGKGANGTTDAWASEPIKVDLVQLLDKGDMTHNVALETGDVVYIPLEKSMNLGESKIYVEGEVKNPGVFDFQLGLTALNACIMAGGFDKFAAPNRARIIRMEGDVQQIIKIDLNDVKEGKLSDVELKPGDRIHIPESYL